jgi:predicted lysophospholipase L1 biosynthesis ABC-type transport system permease subunit
MRTVLGWLCREVVGISESARQGSLRVSQLDSEFFVPFEGPPEDADPRVLLIRRRPGSPAAVASITTAIRNAASDLPYVRLDQLLDLANEEASSWRLGATIFGLFGILAVVLSGVGMHAALAFSMRQRTAEIGVRMALGADARHIARLIARHAIFILAIGWLIGGLATAGLTRYIRSLLFDVASGDTPTFVAASLIITAAALAGCVVPAIRASRIDPAVALRMDELLAPATSVTQVSTPSTCASPTGQA